MEADGDRTPSIEKIIFKLLGIKCHIFWLCLWCVHKSRDLSDAVFQSGRKRSERIGGHKNRQNRIVQDQLKPGCLDKEAKKETDIVLENLPVFCLR